MIEDESFRILREKMLRTQIEGRGISDSRVIQAMLKIPRHKFVPRMLREKAYEDHPLPIGNGQTISQPYMVAKMTELILQSDPRNILEIGSGCGYQTAILAEVINNIFCVEISKELFEFSKQILKSFEYKNIKQYHGDGKFGWPEKIEFDAILCAAVQNGIPKPLSEQLKVGGVIVLPLGNSEQQFLYIGSKNFKGEIILKKLFPVLFVEMK